MFWMSVQQLVFGFSFFYSRKELWQRTDLIYGPAGDERQDVRRDHPFTSGWFLRNPLIHDESWRRSHSAPAESVAILFACPAGTSRGNCLWFTWSSDMCRRGPKRKRSAWGDSHDLSTILGPLLTPVGWWMGYGWVRSYVSYVNLCKPAHCCWMFESKRQGLCFEATSHKIGAKKCVRIRTSPLFPKRRAYIRLCQCSGRKFCACWGSCWKGSCSNFIIILDKNDKTILPKRQLEHFQLVMPAAKLWFDLVHQLAVTKPIWIFHKYFTDKICVFF